ncbi:hypothetical protein M406DRAFT_357639 [Cryphonectria parasitica EP155]|uniref:Ornithine decarboxylase antizyme n=1 Tax=Cryphonectria parasitica (strain ATCC 38755 / EP155) TaxID=660469 RepID=A0A9P4XXX0_CRYP1|nr:uncharacterized protein M406DRAFT_357639 [Cryphonectria parasitica EP155]KAF3762938.1 hypothetical protein M406DRAFT_357639 [Cryphonectria parasitica EP155]
MKVVFHGEENAATHGSGLTGVYQHHHQHQSSSRDRSQSSDTGRSVASVDSGYFGSYTCDDHRSDVHQCMTLPCDSSCSDDNERTSLYGPCTGTGIEATSWMEIWDYQGGASFLAFVAEDLTTGEKSLFTFFDAGVVGRDLKKALVALIELAETPLGCSRLVICIDRSIEADEMQSLTKGLAWAGFEMDTLDRWAEIRDVTSSRWLFMGMEV